MQAIAEKVSLLKDYSTFTASREATSEETVALRKAGLERFEANGLPSIKQEEWRFTNIAPIARTSFRYSSGNTYGLTREKLEPFLLPGCLELVFVNGCFSSELSQTEALPEGVFVGSLAEALERSPELVHSQLGKHVDVGHPFVALNTAHLFDGAFIFVPRGVIVEQTLHALFIGTSPGGEAVVSYPRNLFIVGENAQVTIVETYGGFGEEVYFTCPVTEIVGAESSVVDHYKLSEDSLGAFHVAMQKVHLARNASFFSHSISHGGALVRNDIQAMLAGEGINCTLNGLYLARGNQQVDNQMLVDHAMPNCNSYELYKGVLEGRSRATFNGRIHVHPGAQKTDAKQSNRNLLLSESALVHSNPQLEIFADDVRCTHGSTTGHLEDEAVFYLRSRGISEEAAKSLLTYAFAAEVLQEIRLDEVRKDVEEFLFTRLPKGEVVRQAV